ncbi:uncharacterized protein LOC110856935 [Folsomia candida]|uniref:La-related protein 6 n=1 Tax=Folsomia candida TaxID=158441 RepID=A0A226F3M8_FOLCA|nr:uncharacterized protein LOC110856935 [Folsomia candida]OXA63960.1 La-related protein 6 [Folsomia candida]
MVVVDNMGMEQENKTWAIVYAKSQSLWCSLLVNLVNLLRLWHSFCHLCYLRWVSGGEKGNWSLIGETDINASTYTSDCCAQQQQEEQADDVTTYSKKKMTIQVSAMADAMVSPDQDQHVHEQVHKFSLPITLRLNSEELLEGSSDGDEDLLIDEFNRRGSTQKTEDRDSCSGYSSGSGSSLPGSPIPSSNLKELAHLSSDEHENDCLNGGEAVALAPRRDSDSSTASDDVDVEVSPEVAARIVSQVESMFSDDHLAKDGFLLKHVRRRSDGFVSLKLVAGLRKVKQISREFPVVLNALKSSDSLEVNTDGTKIRRKEPLTSELKAMPIKQAKKEKTAPGGDKEKNQAEKENQNLSDDQQLARKRRQKGDRLNELHYDRGNQQQNQYYKNTNSGRSSFSSTTDESPLRRRGGSLPIAALAQHRGSTAGNYLYPNASPPNAASGFLRPKSNSYSEGTDPSAATMSSWLQKRKASAASTRLSSGEISPAGVIRQPRGPDGSKGFHPGYRTLILEERLQREMMQQLSAFSA